MENCKAKFTSHKQYSFFLKNVEKTYSAKWYCKGFYSVWKETSHKPSKVVDIKNLLPSLYVIRTTCFDECFSFHVVIVKHYFLCKFIVTQRFFATTMLLPALKQLFWKKSVYYVRYLHNKITMLLIPKVQTKDSTSQISSTNLIFENSF